MDEFNTKEKVEELFKSVDGLGENNCIFLCFIDTNREGLKYGALGALGAVGGGAIAGVAAFSSGIVDGMNRKSDGYLINWTESGLGIIPLDATGVMLTLTPAKLKADKKKGITGNSLKGKNIALLFEKPSTRTRCSFTIGCVDEGAHPEYLGKDDIQLGHKESVEDTARVLGRMFDGIEFRGFLHENVEKLAKYSGVPVWNGLTDDYHPTQILADFLTLREQFGEIKGLNFVFAGDGRNNMSNSLMIGCSKMGLNFTCLAPKSLWPNEELVKQCEEYAKESGAKIRFTEDVKEAVEGADCIYTDVWASMGEEDKAAERIALLRPYQVNKEMLEMTGKDTTVVMHCLPAVKGHEITEDVFEHYADVIFDEAENRMHTIKAVMVATLGEY